MNHSESRAERRASLIAAGAIADDSAVESVTLEYVAEPQILPLWARRIFYVIGSLAGAGALIVGGYDPELAKNIAGAGAVIVASLALANPSR